MLKNRKTPAQRTHFTSYKRPWWPGEGLWAQEGTADAEKRFLCLVDQILVTSSPGLTRLMCLRRPCFVQPPTKIPPCCNKQVAHCHSVFFTNTMNSLLITGGDYVFALPAVEWSLICRNVCKSRSRYYCCSVLPSKPELNLSRNICLSMRFHHWKG